MEEEQGGEDAYAVVEPHPSRPSGDENPTPSLPPDVDVAGSSQCDRAEWGGEAGCSSVPLGSSPLSPPSDCDAGVVKVPPLESAPDATSVGDGDAAGLEDVEVGGEEGDDTTIPQCEHVAGRGEEGASPSCSDGGVEKVVAFEPDAGTTVTGGDDPPKEVALQMAAEEVENMSISELQQEKDGVQAEVLTPQGSPGMLPSGSDGDNTATTAGGVDAVSKMDVDSAPISQWLQDKEGVQEVDLMPQGSHAVSPSGSDGGLLKFAALKTDTIAATAVDDDAVEEAVSKMDVDSVPILECKQAEDSGEAHVSMPKSSPPVSPSGSDVGFEKLAACKPDTVATMGDDDAVKEEVVASADTDKADNVPLAEGEQMEDFGEAAIMMPQGSVAESSSGFDGGDDNVAVTEPDADQFDKVPQGSLAEFPSGSDRGAEDIAAVEPDTATVPHGNGDTVDDDAAQMDAKADHTPFDAPISVPQCSLAEFPSGSDRGHENIAAIEPEMATMFHGSADALNDEAAQMDAEADDTLFEVALLKHQGPLAEMLSGADRGDENIAAVEPETAPTSHDSADAMNDEATQMNVDADDTPVVARRSGGRRKRGRPAKTQVVRTPSRRKEEEEVCFICFDGGDLVVCDRRGCPKVYHPSCVNRDEAFFRAKGRWSCGWHICSSCERSAHYMCFTCTYSLCKGCIKEAGFFCVRGNKGFCETCMSTVMLIETNECGNQEMTGIDFDDRSSFEYLFKDYWLGLKAKLSLTREELTRAKNPTKRSELVTGNESSDDLRNAKEALVASSDSSSEHKEETISSRRKVRKRSKNTVNEEISVNEVEEAGTSVSRDTDWASDELLEFVAHMRNGDRSALSQFDVQGLLLEYIKRNNLRDPRRKSQIVCDSRLVNLFGKPRVGHFEMLKLLESHFLMKEVSPLDTEDKQGGVVDPDPDPDPDQVDAKGNSDASTKITPDKKRKTRKKEEKELLTNLDDFAAIDVHNISLMYLRRNLMEELVGDISFDDKVIGSFVRIRISGVGQRQDMYRLVQVVGTGKAAARYKSGKKTTDVTLEILNLNKKEVITIDIISNQDFTEEECKRLRQSIKCGFIGRLTAGDVLEKARSLQSIRVNDWLESEKLRLGHLRDRASEKGRRKELRECVEKLQLLNTPEERNRRLNEVPEIHTDPHMDPDYESAEEEEEADLRKQDYYNRSRGSSFLRNGRELKSPGKGGSSSTLSDNWSNSRKNLSTWESNRNTLTEGASIADSSAGRGVNTTEFSLNQTNDVRQVSSSEATKNHVHSSVSDASLCDNDKQHMIRPEESSDSLQGNQKASLAGGLAAVANTGESDKIWHYKDPSGKIQGPFSMIQLRKWSTTGYFPPNLTIWRTSEKPEDSILLNDALVGKFQKDLPEWEPPNSTSQSVVSPTAFSAGTNAEGVWRRSNDSSLSNSKQSTQKWNVGQTEKWVTQPSSWSSPKMEVSSGDKGLLKDANAMFRQAQGQNSPQSISPLDGNQPQAVGSLISTGRSDAYQDRGSTWNSNNAFVSQPSGQCYENTHPNWSSPSQQFSSSTLKVPQVNDSSHQWRNDSSNVPIPTPQTNNKGWSIAEGSLNKHLPSSAPVQEIASGWATTTRGREEPKSSSAINEPSRSTLNSFRELSSCSAQYVLDQTVISDGGKSLPTASLSAPDTVFLGQTEALTQHPDGVNALGNFQEKNAELASAATSDNKLSEMNQRSNVADFGGSNSSQFGAGLCSNQSLEMNMALTHEQAAHESLSSEYNQLPSSQLNNNQDHIFVSHDQDDPGKELLRTHERSSDESKRTSDGSGPSNDSVTCAQVGTSTVSYPGSNLMREVLSEAPDLNARARDTATNLIVQPAAFESSSAQRPQTSAAPTTEPYISGPESMRSGNFEVQTHTISDKSMSSAPHMTPYGWNSVADAATVNTESVQLLPPSDGSNPLLSSQLGLNAPFVPVQLAQLGISTGSNVQSTSFPVASQNTNPNSGPAQGTGSMSWAPAPQGNMNVNWGMVAPGNMNMSWGQPSQTIPNMNMGLGAQNQVNTMMNSGWVAPAQGNTNMNIPWVNPVMGNANQTSGWGGQVQGNFAVNPVWAMLVQGQTNPSPGWAAPVPPNSNQNWETPTQGTMNMNAAWGTGQGNINPSMNMSAGNPQSLSSQPPSGDRHSGQGDNLRGNDPGHANRRPPWNRMQSGGGSSLPPRGQTGICRFHEMGHCKKGASCNYIHP